MLPESLNRAQIERAERTAEQMIVRRMLAKLDVRQEDKEVWESRVKRIEAAREAKDWRRANSLETRGKPKTVATRRQEYTFTDEQFRIALAALEKQDK